MDTPAATNDRGLRAYPPISGVGGGHVEVQESSLATQPALWLTVRSGPSGSMSTVQIGTGEALVLSEELFWLATHHYQHATELPEGETL